MVLDFNKAVVNMHKGFGFQNEGLIRSQIAKPEGLHDAVLLGLARSEWRESHLRIFDEKLRPLGEYSIRYSDDTCVTPPEN